MARSSSRFRAVQQGSDLRLLADLLWFCLHSLAAEALLAATILAISLFGPDPDSMAPRLIATLLAFIVPLAAAALLARLCGLRNPRIRPARYCWVAGLLLLTSAAVWLSGTPLPPGVCDACGGFEKLWRTFFALRNGTGLLNGDGPLIGFWAPLATCGYSLGARWAGAR